VNFCIEVSWIDGDCRTRERTG